MTHEQTHKKEKDRLAMPGSEPTDEDLRHDAELSGLPSSRSTSPRSQSAATRSGSLARCPTRWRPPPGSSARCPRGTPRRSSGPAARCRRQFRQGVIHGNPDRNSKFD